jgi:UDP-N-acetyl-D-mannosaminuronic acid dehydrogenase
MFARDVAVVGGAGHVGLPLAMTFADSGLRTVIYDIDRPALAAIRRGEMPFAEEGGPETLGRVLAGECLEITDRPDLLTDCEFVVLIIGTPVDEQLSPDFVGILNVVGECAAYLRDGQVVVLRSTIFPGISERVQRDLRDRGLDVTVAFCPERVAQGHSLREIRELPQIISAFDATTLDRARTLFARFVDEFVEMAPMEAELTKLMTNAWRYLQFAAVNQFYMVATARGLDFDRILHGCRHKYPRMAGMPGPGLAAGPCLRKDTLQLAAFTPNNFPLGHAAMLVNEGLPRHLIELAKAQLPLVEKTAGILGMAFKAESDDRRDSLSYKLRKMLLMEARRVLCADPYVRDPALVPADQVLEESDVVFVGAPHRVYRGLVVPPGKLVVDVWNCVKPASR